MSRQWIAVAVLALAVPLVGSCGPDASSPRARPTANAARQDGAPPASAASARPALALSKGMTAAQVREQIGEPERTSQMPLNGHAVEFWSYPDWNLAFRDGALDEWKQKGAAASSPASGAKPASSSWSLTDRSSGEERTFGQLAVKPLGVWAKPLQYHREVIGSDALVTRNDEALVLAVKVRNVSEGQVFAPGIPNDYVDDPWTVTDNWGNRTLVMGICQFADWPASGGIGEQPQKLRPGESCVLVFVAEPLENPAATSLSWDVEVWTDNHSARQSLSVRTGVPAECS